MSNLSQIEELTKRLNDVNYSIKRIDNNIKHSINAIEDMWWQKDLKNRFVRVNKSMCDKLLLMKEEDVIWKNWIEIAEILIKKGIKYTAWRICTESDNITKEKKKTCQFLEDFIVKWKKMYLSVIKSPLYDLDWKLIWTVGIWRDITNEVEEHKQLVKYYKNKELEKFEKLLESHVNKYYFTNKDEARLIKMI